MAFLFGSKAQRTFKKIQDLASSDMVDQSAVMIEEELDNLMEDHDIAAKLVPFLMDIGHPDLGGRIGEKVIRRHSDLRMTVTRLLEEKQAQFPRSIELLRVIWKSRLHQKDFNGLSDLLGRTERVTVNRFADSIHSSWQALSGVTGRELGAGIDRILAWSVITLHKGNPRAAMDVLVDAAERCRFPEESLARLSGWIAARTGGTDMEVNLKRIRVLTAIGDRERAISELPSLYDAESEILNRAISLVEKELVPHDSTPKSEISLARLMTQAGRVNEACLILDPLIEKHSNSSLLEQAVSGMVLGASGSARVHLLQARLRLSRGENTQALDSVERAFQCPDVAESPVVDICQSFIESGIDRDGLVTGKLGEFLVEKGSVEEAVKILVHRTDESPEWVLEKLQLLLKRDRTSAAVLTLLAVVLLVLRRGGEASATLKHLSARHDVKSKQDIVSVLGRFDHLMSGHPELRRLRAASGAKSGAGSDSAADWFELVLGGEKVAEEGYLAIFDSNLMKDRGEDLLNSSFEAVTPAGMLLAAKAILQSGKPGDSAALLTQAMESPDLVDRVTGVVSSLPFSSISAMNPNELFRTLNKYGRGEVVAKLLPLLASTDSREWMDDLATEVVLGSDSRTVFFRMQYFIDTGKPGTGAASVKNLDPGDESILNLVEGCSAVASGDREKATEALSRAAASEKTASLAKAVLYILIEKDRGSTSGVIALAKADLNTGNVKSAAETLHPMLDKAEVLEFLEQVVQTTAGAHELHGSLALARLYAENPVGYREEAGIAAEGDSGLIEELVEKGASYSVEKNYAHGMLFAAELGMEKLKDFDPSDLLIRAVCLEPDLHERIGVSKISNPVLKMLLALASADSRGFTVLDMPEWVKLPCSMITNARIAWSAREQTDALVQLEVVAEKAGYQSEAHLIRKKLAQSGVNRSEKLLEDAVEFEDLRMDFLELCSSGETAESSIERLFPRGILQVDKEQLSAAVSMLIRCGSKSRLFSLAEELLREGSEEYAEAAGSIVSVYMPTAGEAGSLTVKQVVTLLLLSERIPEAFSMARGDSALLAKVRKARKESDSSSDSPESLIRSGRFSEYLAKQGVEDDPVNTGEVLWRAGDRSAACGVWRKAYSDSSDPAFLARLCYALECMGNRQEAEASRRLLSEKHPGYLHRTGKVNNSSTSLDIITYSFN